VFQFFDRCDTIRFVSARVLRLQIDNTLLQGVVNVQYRQFFARSVRVNERDVDGFQTLLELALDGWMTEEGGSGLGRSTGIINIQVIENDNELNWRVQMI
jgi:hypothetical protein